LFEIVCSLSACGGAAEDPVGAAVAPDLAPDPTIHPAFPIIPNQGGPVLASIEQWIIIWQGDEARGEQAKVFTEWLLHSDYWTISLPEYGVGPGVMKDVLVVPSAAPATFDVGGVQQLIEDVTTAA